MLSGGGAAGLTEEQLLSLGSLHAAPLSWPYVPNLGWVFDSGSILYRLSGFISAKSVTQKMKAWRSCRDVPGLHNLPWESVRPILRGKLENCAFLTSFLLRGMCVPSGANAHMHRDILLDI